MDDPTEAIRLERLAQINQQPGSREALEARHERVWNTPELAEEFIVEGFLAPYVLVRRRSDGQRGSMEFRHSPRFYFNFVEDHG